MTSNVSPNSSKKQYYFWNGVNIPPYSVMSSTVIILYYYYCDCNNNLCLCFETAGIRHNSHTCKTYIIVKNIYKKKNLIKNKYLYRKQYYKQVHTYTTHVSTVWADAIRSTQRRYISNLWIHHLLKMLTRCRYKKKKVDFSKPF